MVLGMNKRFSIITLFLLMINTVFIFSPMHSNPHEKLETNIFYDESESLSVGDESETNLFPMGSSRIRNSLEVPEVYPSISAAVLAAGPSGDTIRVSEGQYIENIIVPSGKSITIQGMGPGFTEINGSGAGSVITVNGDYCTINGFKITNSGVEPGAAGILLNSNHNTIENCHLEGNNRGIHLNNSNFNKLDNNTVVRNFGMDPATSGLVGYWRMDDVPWGGEVKDFSGLGNDGTIYGGMTNVPGILGTAGNFDGVNDYISIPHVPEFNMGDGLTISAWVKYNTKGAYDKIISKSYSSFPTSPYQEWAIGLDGAASNFAFELSIGNTLHLIESRTIPQLGIWYHVTGSFDGSKMCIFVNGIRENFLPTTGSISNYGRDIQIGRYECETNENNCGPIDEVRIYNRPLTRDEILRNFIFGVNSGIFLSNSDDNGLTNNTIDSNKGNGIDLAHSEGNTLMNNELINNGVSGLLLDSSNGNQITSNTVGSNYAADTKTRAGLVGHWKMDEISWGGNTDEVKDDSGFGNHGTAEGGATLSPGRYYNSGFFDGFDDSIEINDDVSHHFGRNDFSMTAWIKTSNSDGDNTILAKPTERDHYNFRIVSGKVRLFVQGNNNMNRWEYSNDDVADNEWHFVSCVYDAYEKDISIYIDGMESSTTVGGTGDPDLVNPGTPLRIGKLYDTGNPRFFDGQIDEICIYNRFLSVNEISHYYENGIRGGIHLDRSNSNTISKNTIIDNSEYGLSVNGHSDFNSIHENFILENKHHFSQAQDDGTGNYWDTGSKGNYWSNWVEPDDLSPFGVVDIVYELDGASMASDDCPLCLKISMPTNLTPYEDHYYYGQCIVEYGYNPGEWDVVTKPNWLTFSNNGSIHGIPNNGDVGTFWINATISDEYCSVSINFILTINNIPPQIITSNIIVIDQDEEYYNDYNSTDDGQGEITWHFVSNATWLYFDNEDGTLFGSPKRSDIGNFSVNISVDDGNGGWDHTEFTLAVLDNNTKPVNQFSFNVAPVSAFRGESVFIFIDDEVPGVGVDFSLPIVQVRTRTRSWQNLDVYYNNEGQNYSAEWIVPLNFDTGPPSFRVMIKDNDGITADWHYVNSSMIILNNLPMFDQNFTGILVYNDHDSTMNLTGYGKDAEDGPSLFWHIIEFGPIGLFETFIKDQSDLTIIPSSAEKSGKGMIRFELNDKDGGSNYRNITVEILDFSTKPNITLSLLSPENSSIINTTSTTLNWTAFNTQGVNITFNVLIGFSPENLSVHFHETINTSIEVDELVNNSTYYWMVQAYLGTTNIVFNSSVFQFTVKIGEKLIHKINVTLEKKYLEITAGSWAEVKITLLNLGEFNEVAEISILGEISKYVIVQNSIDVNIGEEVLLILRFVDVENTLKGKYDVTVSIGYSNITTTETITLVIIDKDDVVTSDSSYWWLWPVAIIILALIIILLLIGLRKRRNDGYIEYDENEIEYTEILSEPTKGITEADIQRINAEPLILDVTPQNFKEQHYYPPKENRKGRIFEQKPDLSKLHLPSPEITTQQQQHPAPKKIPPPPPLPPSPSNLALPMVSSVQASNEVSSPKSTVESDKTIPYAEVHPLSRPKKIPPLPKKNSKKSE